MQGSRGADPCAAAPGQSRPGRHSQPSGQFRPRPRPPARAALPQATDDRASKHALNELGVNSIASPCITSTVKLCIASTVKLAPWLFSEVPRQRANASRRAPDSSQRPKWHPQLSHQTPRTIGEGGAVRTSGASIVARMCLSAPLCHLHNAPIGACSQQAHKLGSEALGSECANQELHLPWSCRQRCR